MNQEFAITKIKEFEDLLNRTTHPIGREQIQHILSIYKEEIKEKENKVLTRWTQSTGKKNMSKKPKNNEKRR